jgi:predicted Zn-ribbon and HTH transcriptional regulator
MKAIKWMFLCILSVFSISAFAQDSTKHKTKMKKQKTETATYCCPNHKDMTSDKPGKCPKCKMEMAKMKGTKMYCCPMHKDMTSDKPGKCSKCGMEMKEKKAGGKS